MAEPSFPVDVETHSRLAERYRVINGPTLKRLISASLNWLRTNQAVVNALNVFPVPDGDTGTNMVLTMQSALEEVESSPARTVSETARAIAHGALMGARGNSGVILSQLWRGFARALDDLETMDAPAFAEALEEAKETAYKGVVKPVEGTILTVSKDIAAAARKARENGTASVLKMLEQVVAAADESVERTPDLLPILKEAGVVDSGGKGLFFILEGILRAAYRQPLDKPIVSVVPLSDLNLEGASEAIEPGQDWEVVVDFRPNGELNLSDFYAHLEELGTSIQVGEGDGMYRMHIHVPDKTEYKPIEYVKKLGMITNVAIENLMAQMEDQAKAAEPAPLRLAAIEPDQIAAVTVAPGRGLANIFASLGAAAVIEGGQTMNPSTQEILGAFENLPTDQIVILPNNKNIILAAEQAKELTVKQVAVVPTVTVPQGIAAMFALNPDGELEKVTAAMRAAIEDVQTVEITIATRSVEIDGVDIQEGQVIGLLNGKLVCSGKTLEEVMLKTLELARAEAHELITIYYGSDLSAMEANQLADRIRPIYPDQEVEVVEGGQPHYRLILSIE